MKYYSLLYLSDYIQRILYNEFSWSDDPQLSNIYLLHLLGAMNSSDLKSLPQPVFVLGQNRLRQPCFEEVMVSYEGVNIILNHLTLYFKPFVYRSTLWIIVPKYTYYLGVLSKDQAIQQFLYCLGKVIHGKIKVTRIDYSDHKQLLTKNEPKALFPTTSSSNIFMYEDSKKIIGVLENDLVAQQLCKCPVKVEVTDSSSIVFPSRTIEKTGALMESMAQKDLLAEWDVIHESENGKMGFEEVLASLEFDGVKSQMSHSQACSSQGNGSISIRSIPYESQNSENV